MIAEQVRAHDFLHEIQGRGVQQQVSPQAPPRPENTLSISIEAFDSRPKLG